MVQHSFYSVSPQQLTISETMCVSAHLFENSVCNSLRKHI